MFWRWHSARDRWWSSSKSGSDWPPVVTRSRLSTITSEEDQMALPSDEKVVQLANDLLVQFDAIFGLHPGFRAAHAKGIMLSGIFTPSPEAASLTRAPHITRDQTPVTVRF